MGFYCWLNRRLGPGSPTNRPSSGSLETPINRGEVSGPPVSLVLLLSKRRAMDTNIVAQAVHHAFGVDVSEDEESPYCVTGESPHFLLRLEDRLFAVNNVGRPYFINTAAVAAEVSEMRLRRAVASHRAWLSVDFLYAQEGTAGSPYPAMGRLVAALADQDCLAICVPSRRSLYVYEENVPEKLRSADPLRALNTPSLPPVIDVDPDDPRLQTAIAEARRRWPEFVAAFEQRESGQVFSVKAPIREGKATEHMWLTVTALENEMIYGRLDNEPVDVKRVRTGDRLRVPVGELSDWLYTCGESIAGGFTINVLGRRNKRR